MTDMDLDRCEEIFRDESDDTGLAVVAECRQLRKQLDLAPYYVYVDLVAKEQGRENQNTIWQWVLETFGVPTIERAIDRLYEELMELQREVEWAETGAPDHAKLAEECADVVICMTSVFSSLSLDLQEAIDRKMAVNRARKWRTNGDGVGHHIEEGEDGA